MDLQRLWCVLAIISFSMPVFAATPYQIDSLDDFNNVAGPNWVETTGTGYGSYVEQQVGGPNVTEGSGSMKFDFTTYVAGDRDDEVTRTYSPNTVTVDPNLDFSNYKDLAVTIWVWTNDPNYTVDLVSKRGTRLKEIILNDGSARVGVFTLPHLTDIGWNKVIAPLRNFIWDDEDTDPCDVDWDDITEIKLWARTETASDHNDALYLDDLQLEDAPDPCSRPYQLASFDSIWDELWYEDHGNIYMLQSDFNTEGDGSVMIDFNNSGSDASPDNPDIRPVLPLIPALDFTDESDWAITVWVWTDLVLDAYIWEITLIDVMGNTGRLRLPRADINTGYGWNKITAPIDELLWSDETSTGGRGGIDYANLTSSQVKLDTIVELQIWCMTFPFWGNSIYLDDLRIEANVKLPSDANVYNAEKVTGTITIDGNAIDWVGLVDSDPIDFDMATINWTEPSGPNFPSTPAPGQWNHTGSGDLHVKYRLAWDPNYLYILVEEQSGDTEAYEAPTDTELMSGGLNAAGTFYDSLALALDFTNNRVPGNEMHVGFWLWLGLDSGGATDLIGCLVNQDRSNFDAEAQAALVGSAAATSGTLGSRVIEAKVKWSVLNTAIDPWFLPDANVVAAVQPGYMFGCDPRLLDLEGSAAPWSGTHAMGWLSGIGYGVGWPQGYHRWPTGRDTYSIDIRLVCSAGDLDFDCDVDFVDYAQFAAKWLDSGCTNVNDFCNGADIIIDGAVTSDDLGRFTERWLDGL